MELGEVERRMIALVYMDLIKTFRLRGEDLIRCHVTSVRIVEADESAQRYCGVVCVRQLDTIHLGGCREDDWEVNLTISPDYQTVDSSVVFVS
ncbi:MAG: hypothetical protein Q7S37_02900 [bacterium]|nr:hypothetical protein [bacterium]